jgi:hypothetical protein
MSSIHASYLRGHWFISHPEPLLPTNFFCFVQYVKTDVSTSLHIIFSLLFPSNSINWHYVIAVVQGIAKQTVNNETKVKSWKQNSIRTEWACHARGQVS